MEFDSFTLLLLHRPADAPDLTEAEADVLQDGHLANLAALHARGVLVAAGPLLVGPDHPLRGIGLFTCSVDEAAAYMAEDPAVQARWFEATFETWMCPAGAMSFTPTFFPSSVADVTG